MSNLLISGGAGYIGSHATRHFTEAGHKVVVLDNLNTGHVEALPKSAIFQKGDVADNALVAGLVKEHKIDSVLHFAAHIEVGESVSDPAKYFENNFSNALQFLRTVTSAGVKRFVFSSTAAVYGNPKEIPIKETAETTPLNPYGKSKLMVEWALADFARAHGLGYAVLRYFNVAGAHPDGTIGEDHRPESHLIPRILQAALDTEVSLPIYGNDYPTPDGTCVRDYVHVCDLIDAHALALDAIKPGVGNTYNLGSENGFSVLEVLNGCAKVTGRKIKTEIHPRRPGDSAFLVADSRKIRSELGWSPKYPQVETILRHAWQWHSTHPQGYATNR